MTFRRDIQRRADKELARIERSLARKCASFYELRSGDRIVYIPIPTDDWNPIRILKTLIQALALLSAEAKKNKDGNASAVFNRMSTVAQAVIKYNEGP